MQPKEGVKGKKVKVHTRQRLKQQELILVSLVSMKHALLNEMLVLRRVTSQQYVAGTHIPPQREKKLGKVPCLRKQCDGLEPRNSRYRVQGVNHTHMQRQLDGKVQFFQQHIY